MTETTPSIVVGLFEHRTDVAKAVTALLAADFHDDQIGFAARDDEALTSKAHKTEPIQSHAQLQGEGTETVETDATATHPHSIVRGIVGGIMGALDMLLVPITGPADANIILESTLPVAEQAIDRLPYRNPKASEAQREETTLPARPDATMTLPTSSTQTEQQPAEEERHTTHEGASIVTGGVIGGVLGAAVALLIPGIGPVISGGILASVLGGAALGGVAGNFFGTFTEMGIPAEHAHRYEHAIRTGYTIVTIKTSDRQQEASQILREHGAHDIQVH
jgi:hypothetical protein